MSTHEESRNMMSVNKKLGRACVKLTVFGLMALGLSACITLLPDEKPAQLYRFGYASSGGQGSDVQDSGGQGEVRPDKKDIYLSDIEFPKAASNDRILTTQDLSVNYIANVRWASPAQDLFKDALSYGFDRSGQGVRLSTQGRGSAAYRLDIKVRHFEVAYIKNRPVIEVSLDASVVRISDRKLMVTRLIRAEQKVDHNRVSDIAQGFETATSRAIDEVINLSQSAVSK